MALPTAAGGRTILGIADRPPIDPAEKRRIDGVISGEHFEEIRKEIFAEADAAGFHPGIDRP